MKISTLGFALAGVAVVFASPLEIHGTESAGFQPDFNVTATSTDARYGPLSCSTTKKSGSVKDAELVVNYLHSLPHKCTTNVKTNDGHRYAIYYAQKGNTQAVAGVVANKKCGVVAVKCHELGTIFQTMINKCKINGKIQAVHFLEPSQYELVDPKACKKTDTTFYLQMTPSGF